MEHSAKILANEHQHLCVYGVLNLSTVSTLRNLGCHLIRHQMTEEVVFDLKEVVRSDSAGLSLLTAWFRYANQHNKCVRFLNIPDQMLDVAKLSNLDRVLFL